MVFAVKRFRFELDYINYKQEIDFLIKYSNFFNNYQEFTRLFYKNSSSKKSNCKNKFLKIITSDDFVVGSFGIISFYEVKSEFKRKIRNKISKYILDQNNKIKQKFESNIKMCNEEEKDIKINKDEKEEKDIKINKDEKEEKDIKINKDEKEEKDIKINKDSNYNILDGIISNTEITFLYYLALDDIPHFIFKRLFKLSIKINKYILMISESSPIEKTVNDSFNPFDKDDLNLKDLKTLKDLQNEGVVTSKIYINRPELSKFTEDIIYTFNTNGKNYSIFFVERDKYIKELFK